MMKNKKIAKRLWKAKVSVLACVVVATVFGASTALAGTGVGGIFNLGQTNTVDALSTLRGSANNAMLRVVNTNTDAFAKGLSIYTTNGKPPIVVENPNSGTATNLSADKLDGQDSTALLPGGNLPAGRTVRGTYDIRGTVPNVSGGGLGYDSSAISFGYRLARTPTVQIVKVGQPSTTECPGTVGIPEAAKGYLCIYESAKDNLYNSSIYPYNDFVTQDGANIIAWSGNPRYANQTDQFYTNGTWAVTGTCPGILKPQC